MTRPVKFLTDKREVQGIPHAAIPTCRRIEEATVDRLVACADEKFDEWQQICDLVARGRWLDAHHWIKGWFNPHRLHSSNGYRSPIETETDWYRHHTDGPAQAA